MSVCWLRGRCGGTSRSGGEKEVHRQRRLKKSSSILTTAVMSVPDSRPVVWSPLGPVLAVPVGRDCRVQSNWSSCACVQPQKLFSKLQLKTPGTESRMANSINTALLSFHPPQTKELCIIWQAFQAEYAEIKESNHTEPFIVPTMQQRSRKTEVNYTWQAPFFATRAELSPAVSRLKCTISAIRMS